MSIQVAVQVGTDVDGVIRQLLGRGAKGRQPWPGQPPVVIEPVGEDLAELDAAVDWFSSHQEEIDRVLVHFGALVLHGFPIQDTDAFGQMVDHYTPHEFGYRGGATPRAVVKGNVYEATQVPGEVNIPLHQEMAYLKRYPTKLAFWCQTAPALGGATVVGDVRRFMELLPHDFLDQLDRKGVTYHRNFRPDGPHGSDRFAKVYHATLQQGFGTDDRAAVEADCKLLGMEFEWEPGGSLSTRLTRDAFATHPVTGDRVYFNHVLTQIIDSRAYADVYESYLDLYDRAGNPRPYHVTYGDGSEVDPAHHRAVIDAMSAVEVERPWDEGDLMLVDNVYTAHGRSPFTGERNVQVALID